VPGAVSSSSCTETRLLERSMKNNRQKRLPSQSDAQIGLLTGPAIGGFVK
jgi:hypothetical protein